MFPVRLNSLFVRLVLIVLLLGGLFGINPVEPVYAADLIVTNTNDSGAGSLRQAILDAVSGNIITFDPSLSGQTITLASQLVLNKNLVIDGSSLASAINISGNNLVTVMLVNSFSIVRLQKLVIKNGSTTENGAGVYVNTGSSLTVVDSTFSANNAATGTYVFGSGEGGAIYNLGTLNVWNSTFTGNIAFRGGAISCSGNSATINISGDTFTSNLAMSDSGGDGGAIFATCTASILNSTFSSNTANHNGGAMLVDNDAASVEVTNNTFINNAGVSGGAVANYGLMVIKNSTFSENNSANGGAVWAGLGSNLSIRDSILANSLAGADCKKSEGVPAVENLNNLIETTGADLSSCGTPSFTSDPALGPLQNNGGSTQTMAIGAGSPAVDSGDDATCAPADQRGIKRPQGVHCDLGAYEFVPTTTTITLTLQPDAAAGVDTFINNNAATTNYGTATVMAVGEDNTATNRIGRGLIRFDLSSIPANATVTSATLSVWTSTDLSNNTRVIRAYRLKVPFNETQATWNISAAGVNWQQAGASGANDRESTAIGSVSIAGNEPLNQEKQIALDAAKVQEWVSGSFVNQGMILAADTELDDLFTYKTSDSTTATQRPKLVIQYSIPGGASTNTPTRTPTSVIPTNTATSTPTRTPTRTPTPTATVSVSSFPTTSVLDGFNRANGAIGGNWSGYNISMFTISSNQLSVNAAGEGYIYWNAASQGADQEAYYTLVQVYPNNSQQSLLLKLHSDGSGTIKVIYNAGTDVVQVFTYHFTQGWVQRGADIPVIFANGDQFGARARADGTVEVYKNGTLLASRSITSWPYYASGGYVGLGASSVSGAVIDNFGGGTR